MKLLHKHKYNWHIINSKPLFSKSQQKMSNSQILPLTTLIAATLVFLPSTTADHRSMCVAKFTDGTSTIVRCPTTNGTGESVCVESGTVDAQLTITISSGCASTQMQCTHDYYLSNTNKFDESEIFYVGGNFLILWQTNTTGQYHSRYEACCNATEEESCNAKLLTKERLREIACQRPTTREIFQHCAALQRTLTVSPPTPPPTAKQTDSRTMTSVNGWCPMVYLVSVQIGGACGLLLGILFTVALINCCLRCRRGRRNAIKPKEQATTDVQPTAAAVAAPPSEMTTRTARSEPLPRLPEAKTTENDGNSGMKPPTELTTTSGKNTDDVKEESVKQMPVTTESDIDSQQQESFSEAPPSSSTADQTPRPNTPPDETAAEQPMTNGNAHLSETAEPETEKGDKTKMGAQRERARPLSKPKTPYSGTRPVMSPAPRPSGRVQATSPAPKPLKAKGKMRPFTFKQQ